MVAASWYGPEGGFFDENYYREYPEAADGSATERQVEFALRVTGLRPPARIVDLGCGPGRHAIGFAERGFSVTAQDVHPALLEVGEREAKNRGMSIEWLCRDMRSIAPREPYDFVGMFFTAFGLLEDDAEDAKVIAAIAEALREGGHVLIDVPHRDWLVRNFAPRAWFEREDGVLILDERLYSSESGRITHNRHRVRRDGVREAVQASIRIYSPPELAAMLELHSICVVGFYGDFTGAPLDMSRPRCIVVGQKN